MKLRTKFLLFVIVLHAVALTLSWFVFRENKWLFLASELFILLSLWFSRSLYLQLLRPLKMLTQGAEALKDKDFSVRLIKTGQSEMDALIEVYNQMLDQLRHERTLQEQQHFFLEKLIFTSPTGIIILDYDGQVQQTNPKAEILLRQLPRLLEDVQELGSGESRTLTINGVNTFKLQKSHFIDRGFARHFVMIEELTTEILAAEKKVYGKVIRMMAHEVNNTIGPVNSIIGSTLKAHTLDPAHQGALEVAVERNQHLNGFMRNFADLVKLPPPERKPLSIQSLLRHAAQLHEARAAEKNIRIHLDFLPHDTTVSGDRLQLEQVLINVIKNAMEAIGSDGDIRIAQLQDAVRISDSGHGVEAPADVFTPFFSTKPDGQGIGLMLVRDILMAHGWQFSLETHLPGDTRFTIRFTR
ncbi:sensor histidine kinase [Chitinophaga rhizosphaerae]|uniref:sensor histidine kinase n=1 Tax=Chitinophaga rhizosphaerae TaxID=1864947 RepID=UPI000F80712F|nr:ATP-binding protein [Chitinophaga rhizosphaerae]